MKKLLFATLALTLVLMTGCKEETSKTDPQQEDTTIKCEFYYSPEGEIMENVDVEIYINDSLVCTLGDSIKEYKNTLGEKATATIETKPVFNVVAPTDTFDIKYNFTWKFTKGTKSTGDGPTISSEECPPEYWESDMKPSIEKDLTLKFVIENGVLPTGPVE